MPPGPLTVVVVDDSSSFREVLVELIDANPQLACVGEARSGAEAVELTGVHRPDLVVMDVRMPGMDGFAAAAAIAATYPATNVVLISADTTPDSESRARDASAYALLDKHALRPASLEQLVAALRPSD